MDTATELAAGAKAYHAHLVAILLTKEGDGSKLFSLVEGHVAVLVQWNVLPDHVVNHTLYLTQLLVADLLKVREVEAQRVGTDKGSLLLYVVAQYLLECIVEQVGSSMVGSRSIALVSIYASHEFCRQVLGQLLDDVDALVVLALGVDDFHRFVLADQDSLFADLTTHFAIEGCEVEHQFVVLVLLLGYLAVAQNVTGVLREVVAYELLLLLGVGCWVLGVGGLTIIQHRTPITHHLNPVAILYGSGIAGTLFLLLHLSVKLLFVNGDAMLAADELRQVERETVCVEQAEGLHAVKDELGVGCWVLGVGC